MSGPTNNFDFGRMQHREYESQAGCRWRTPGTRDARKRESSGTGGIWALSILLVAVFLGIMVLLYD